MAIRLRAIGEDSDFSKLQTARKVAVKQPLKTQQTLDLITRDISFTAIGTIPSRSDCPKVGDNFPTELGSFEPALSNPSARAMSQRRPRTLRSYHSQSSSTTTSEDQAQRLVSPVSTTAVSTTSVSSQESPSQKHSPPRKLPKRESQLLLPSLVAPAKPVVRNRLRKTFRQFPWRKRHACLGTTHPGSSTISLGKRRSLVPTAHDFNSNKLECKPNKNNENETQALGGCIECQYAAVQSRHNFYEGSKDVSAKERSRHMRGAMQRPSLLLEEGKFKSLTQDIAQPPHTHSFSARNVPFTSLCKTSLDELRSKHLQDQRRFIAYRASQIKTLKEEYQKRRCTASADLDDERAALRNRQAQKLNRFEDQQLAAESELLRTLELERRGCDTRLRHMQAYCDPRGQIQGMPKRTVTEADHEFLRQQYHIRACMPALHSAQINALRERQASRTETFMAQQEQELIVLEKKFKQDEAKANAEFSKQYSDLINKYDIRKQKLIRRWNLAEAVLCKKLELESGQSIPALAPIKWPSCDDEVMTGPEAPSPIGSLV